MSEQGGADINTVHGENGATALTLAATALLPHVVAVCMELGADCTWITDNGLDAQGQAEEALANAQSELSATQPIDSATEDTNKDTSNRQDKTAA